MSSGAPFPHDEEKRIQTLHELNMLDTPSEERFNRITRIAQNAFHVPIVLISLVDTHRQWFKAQCGIDNHETPREESFCAYTLLDRMPLVVSDAHEDPRFADNTNVIQEPFIRFYAGYPIKGPEEYILGTLCIIDHTPRQFQPYELDLLRDLAQIVEREIHLTATQNTLVSQWKQSYLFHSIFDHAALGMVVLDHHGTFVEWNHAFEQLVGRSGVALKGLCAPDIIDEQYQSQMKQVLHDIFIHAISFKHVEHQYTRQDGKTLTLSTTLSLVLDPFSEQDFCIGLLEDVTARVHAEQRVQQVLQEKEELMTTLRALLETANTAIVFLSVDERVNVLNHYFLEWFGLDLTLLLHASFEQFCDHLLPLFARKHKLSLLFQQDHLDPSHCFTEKVQQMAPEQREIEIQSSPVYLPSKDYLGRLYLMRDITKEREMERMKNDFVSLVTHELRTPLTSINGFVDLLLEETDRLDKEQQEFLQIVDENTHRLMALVNELLDLAHIESGKMKLERIFLDLNPLINTTLQSFAPSLKGKQQSLEVSLEQPSPVVFADSLRVQQILCNLVSNAHKYTIAGGTLRVSTQVEQHQVWIAVQDSGVGMTEEEQAQLFLRFFRAKNQLTGDVGGTGLGLAITRSLVEMHGGVIQMQSQPGQGSTFRFTLPLDAAQPLLTL